MRELFAVLGDEFQGITRVGMSSTHGAFILHHASFSTPRVEVFGACLLEVLWLLGNNECVPSMFDLQFPLTEKRR